MIEGCIKMGVHPFYYLIVHYGTVQFIFMVINPKGIA